MQYLHSLELISNNFENWIFGQNFCWYPGAWRMVCTDRQWIVNLGNFSINWVCDEESWPPLFSIKSQRLIKNVSNQMIKRYSVNFVYLFCYTHFVKTFWTKETITNVQLKIKSWYEITFYMKSIDNDALL